MNKWIRLGIAVILYTSSLYLLWSIIKPALLVFGLILWWLVILYSIFWLEAQWATKWIEDD